MSFLKRPFSLGSLSLENNIFYAPLAGCSDYPFRKVVVPYRPGLFFCEMVKMDPLVRHDPGTYRYLDYSADMHPIGAQLCGSQLQLAKEAAKILEDLGFDLIDFNCGCPVDKVTKDGSGSGMLKDPQKIGDILHEMRSAVQIPVTVKIRAGWDESSIQAPQITRIAEQAGASAITIHGRTREQGYKGLANWDHITACKREAKEIAVIGNGDLFSPLDVERMFASTGCDGVLIARGTLGRPFIVHEVIEHLSGLLPSSHKIEEALLNHMETVISYQSEKQALIDFRRIGSWYLKDLKELRMELHQSNSTEDALDRVRRYRDRSNELSPG